MSASTGASTLSVAPRPLTPRILARLADTADEGAASPSGAATALAPPASAATTTGAGRMSAPVTSGRGPGPRRSGWSRPSRIVPVAVAAVAVVVALLVVVDRGEAGPGPGEALVAVDGLAIVTRVDGTTDRISSRTRLDPGDRIAMVRGSATMELDDDVVFEAMAGVGDAAGTDLLMGRVPSLRAGPLLVSSVRSTTVDLGGDGADLDGGATVRVTRARASRLDVFRGRADLRSAGAVETVGALRSAEVVAPGDVTDPRPLVYTDGDPWDRRLLGPALALDRQLAPLRAGLAASAADVGVLAQRLQRSVGTEVPDVELRRVLLDRSDAFDAAVGLAVTASSDQNGSYVERWGVAFGFRDDGARWGLVAMDIGADPDRVIALLTTEIDGAPLGGVGVGSGPAGSAGLNGSADPNDPATLPRPGQLGGGTGDTADPAGPNGTTAPGGGDSPGGPDATLPGGASGPTSPPVSTPGVSTPGVSLPGLTVPSVSVPGVSLPGVSLPGVSLPGVSLPGVSLPPVTLPITLPPVTLPITVPPILPTIPIVGPILGGPLLGGGTSTGTGSSGGGLLGG